MRHPSPLQQLGPGGSSAATAPGGLRLPTPRRQPRRLTRSPAPSAPPSQPDDAHESRPTAAAPRQVWVVDDDPVVALYLGELLKEHGHLVTTFADPRLALQACEADPERVDVVVTDQRMPKLSGDKLARAMLKLRPQLCVILCTGYSEAIDEQRALAMGIQHFFHKPFDAQALLQAVRDARPASH